MEQMGTMKRHALWYASLGWAVFPCHSIVDNGCTCGKPDCGSAGKHPMTPRGHVDASTDDDTVCAWWDRWPEANIGFAVPADMVVVDVDIKHDEGKYGDDTLAGLIAQLGEPLPDTVMQLTGGGGIQLFFHTDVPMQCKNDALPAIDIKTKGGYVILPPSLHKSGTRYEWALDSSPHQKAIAPIPPLLRTCLVQPQPAMTGVKSAPSASVEAFRPGQRNDGLFKMAGSMRAKGFSDAAIESALLQENEKRCKPPLSRNKNIVLSRSRKVLILQHFSGFFCFGGYKLATFGAFL